MSCFHDRLILDTLANDNLGRAVVDVEPAYWGYVPLINDVRYFVSCHHNRLATLMGMLEDQPGATVELKGILRYHVLIAEQATLATEEGQAKSLVACKRHW